MAKSGYIPRDETLKRIYGMDGEAMEQCAGHLMVGGGTRGGPILHHGKGVRVWDVEGKEYIDCTSQSWALYLGYANEEVWGAVNEHAQNLTHTHQGFDTLTRFALAKRLAEIAPPDINRVSFVPTSALAVEGAMKLALKNRPGSSHFLCLWDAWHGTTLGTMGASWISTQASGSYAGGSRFLPLTRQFVRAPNPYCYRCYFDQKPERCNLMCARMLELTIQKGVNGPPAGLVMEPLQASGGQILHTGHAFGMLGRSVHKRFGAIQVDEVIAHVLRLFSQGLKVGCECACMAADAGLIRSGEEVLSIGGSGQGADTAIVLKASNTHSFFETRVLEVICKPRE